MFRRMPVSTYRTVECQCAVNPHPPPSPSEGKRGFFFRTGTWRAGDLDATIKVIFIHDLFGARLYI